MRSWTRWAPALLLIAQAFAGVAPQAGFDLSTHLKEPYPKLTGGQFLKTAIAESPDPLIRWRWRSVHAADSLQIYTLRPQTATTATPQAFVGLETAGGATPRIVVQGAGSIRFDFGVESAGWLEFDSPDLAGEVEMSISEYNEPAVVNGGPRHPAKTAAPVQYGNTYRLELNANLYEGVRFGWIHARTFARPWHITAIRLVCQTKPANYEGSFAASDPLLTRIWYTGAYAVKLNLLKDYFGAILMDRGDRISWTGDAHPAQGAALVAFGNYASIKQNLERTASVDNSIENYALYWVLSLVEYYRYTGDDAIFDQLAPIARRKLLHAGEIYANPPMQFFGWDERLGAGFENPNIRESKSAYRLLAIRTCRQFAWALEARGRHSEAGETETMAARLTQALDAQPGWDRQAGLHVAAEAVTAGLAERTRSLWTSEFTDRINRLSYSPFNQYFILQAMARVGLYDDALSVVREMWGGQLQYGGTCFFEVFRPSWNQILKPNDAVPNCQAGYTSLCHPWGSGVTKWLSEEILGIQPVAPGFSTWTVVPHPGSTLTRVTGSTPTPHGTISVDLDTARGTMMVAAPLGTLGTIAVPKQNRTILGISVAKQVVWDGAFHQTAGIAGAHEDSQFVYLTGVTPGRRSFDIRYDAPPRKAVEQLVPISWPAKLVRKPPAAGADGSVSFSTGDGGGDERHLPGYIAEVSHHSSRHGQWMLDGRKTGYLMTGNPRATVQTMTVDVRLKQARAYRMSLYFVDGDRQNRRQVVELFDLESGRILAPVEMVADFAAGKYLTYEYNRSCRVRINHVRGGDAVISSISFDSAPDKP